MAGFAWYGQQQFFHQVVLRIVSTTTAKSSPIVASSSTSSLVPSVLDPPASPLHQSSEENTLSSCHQNCYLVSSLSPPSSVARKKPEYQCALTSLFEDFHVLIERGHLA